MDLWNINDIKKILSKHGFSFNKGLGQNFLIDPQVCPRMAEEAQIEDTMGVLEIGPGIGVLTSELCKKAKKVVAVELDKRLPDVLKETLSQYDNVTVIQGDALRMDLNELINEQFRDMPFCVCANLPYYITSPIIMKLLESNLQMKSITVMVQKEAGIRLCAEPGTRDCSSVSAAVRFYSEPEILFDVNRTCFIPSPKVDSCVIKLNVLQSPPVNVQSPEKFFRIVRASFCQRRKTVLNSLSSGLSLPKEEVRQMLKNAGINEKARAEQLKMQDFANLTMIK